MVNSAGGGDEDSGGPVREQDRLLPIANVGRIMKAILPPNAKISKDAKDTMQESVSEFIAFVTAEASDKCRRERRKTVNGDDVCSALSSLGFDDYALALRRYLQRFRDLDGDRAANRSASEDAGDEQQDPPMAGAASRSRMMNFGGVMEKGSSSDSRQQF